MVYDYDYYDDENGDVIAMVGLMDGMMRKESHQGLKAPTVSKELKVRPHPVLPTTNCR